MGSEKHAVVHCLPLLLVHMQNSRDLKELKKIGKDPGDSTEEPVGPGTVGLPNRFDRY